MDINQKNLAETLHGMLPQPFIVQRLDPAVNGPGITRIAVPDNFGIKEFDDEKLGPHPRRTVCDAQLVDAASFIDYVNFHAPENIGATVWCTFDPATYALVFKAVFDEHQSGFAGWRGHRASYAPLPSIEWVIWTGQNRKESDQMGFASFLDDNGKDITAPSEGAIYPTSLEMLAMATAFEANADKKFRSKVRTASGGLAMEFVDTDDEATVAKMRLFERFLIALPVFWTLPVSLAGNVSAWTVEARLKYRVQQGAVRFWYELVRPDMAHQAASMAMIELIRAGIGAVPLRMGSVA